MSGLRRQACEQLDSINFRREYAMQDGREKCANILIDRISKLLSKDMKKEKKPDKQQRLN
jgi:hypothetical protein